MLNIDRYRQKKKETETGGGGNTIRPKDGKNYYRIFKYKHTVTERDFIIGTYSKGVKGAAEIGSVQEEIARPIFVHLMRGMAPQACFIDRKKCEYCSDVRELMAAGEGAAESTRRMRRQERDLINVVDMGDPKKGRQILELSQQPYGGVLEQYFAKLEDGVAEENIFGCTGRDFIITYDKAADISDRYTVSIRDKEMSKELPTELLKTVKDLHNIHAYDPQDAPPVGAGQEEEQMPWEGKKEEEASVASKLKDERPKQDERLGKLIEFSDGTNTIGATIKSVNGTKVIATDTEGVDWELDPTDYKYVQ